MCCLWAFFAKFGLAMGGGSSETKEPKLHKLGVFPVVYFVQIIVKSTQFVQNWVLFFQKWYTDGWEIGQKIGIGKVKFSRSARHIHTDFGESTPPPRCPLQPPMASPMSSYSKILDYRSKIPIFHSIIQDFQEKLGLSIDYPGFSTYFWKSGIFKSKNLDFHFDNPSFFRIIGHWASKILDFLSIIQVFRLSLKILDYQIKKLWFSLW